MTRTCGFTVLLTALVLACGQSGPANKAEAREFIDRSLPMATHFDVATELLQSRKFPFRVFPPADCDGFVYEPRFQCRGGSAIVTTLAENLHPWNPFYSPDLRVFLAFDSQEQLADYIVFIEGGD